VEYEKEWEQEESERKEGRMEERGERWDEGESGEGESGVGKPEGRRGWNRGRKAGEGLQEKGGRDEAEKNGQWGEYRTPGRGNRREKCWGSGMCLEDRDTTHRFV